MFAAMRFRVPSVVLIALVAALSALSAASSAAIQLHWAAGETDLTVSQNTQAVLVVQADSAETTLPNAWRLQWTADSLRLQFSAFGPDPACLADTARVDWIAPPSTMADSAANQITAHFCSSGASNAPSALFLVDLPAGGHGKMRVIALNPADTTQVMVSNDVTYNGGVIGSYAPLVLGASSVHQSLRLRVTAVGANLDGVTSLSIAAPNGSWSLPLTIASHGIYTGVGVDGGLAHQTALGPTACSLTVLSSRRWQASVGRWLCRPNFDWPCCSRA